MPKNFDMNEYNNAEVSTGGGEFKRMTAGGYIVRIQAVRTKGFEYGREIDYPEEKMYVKLIYDIAEGEFAGKFSDDYWADETKDWGHQIYFSWKNMGAFKGNVLAIEESNPGFDAMAAFTADKWALFVGKQVGIVLGEEEYLKSDGTVGTRFGFPRLKSVQDIRDGKFRVPPLKKLPEGAAAPSTSTAASDAYDDVPF